MAGTALMNSGSGDPGNVGILIIKVPGKHRPCTPPALCESCRYQAEAGDTLGRIIAVPQSTPDPSPRDNFGSKTCIS